MCAEQTYRELGVDLGEGVARHAVRDLEIGVVLHPEDASLDLAADGVPGRFREGGGEE